MHLKGVHKQGVATRLCESLVHQEHGVRQRDAIDAQRGYRRQLTARNGWASVMCTQ